MENCRRVILTSEELDNLSKEEIIQKWIEQNAYIDHVESKLENLSKLEDVTALENLKTEMSRQRNIFTYKYNLKEQELQENLLQLHEFKELQAPTNAKLRQSFLDPAINLVFKQMKQELDACKKAKEEVLNDRQAWSFTTESQTGKRLMARCRKLLQENEELGKVVSSGNIAKLETDVALQKRLVIEMRQQEKEYESIIQEMDEEMEAMTCACTHLQQRLNDTLCQMDPLYKRKNEATRSVAHTDHGEHKTTDDKNSLLQKDGDELNSTERGGFSSSNSDRSMEVSDSSAHPNNATNKGPSFPSYTPHNSSKRKPYDSSNGELNSDTAKPHSVEKSLVGQNINSPPSKFSKLESVPVISNGQFQISPD